MGEARRRGTFEERKAEAIKAGRVKNVKTKRRNKDFTSDMFLSSMFSIFPWRK